MLEQVIVMRGWGVVAIVGMSFGLGGLASYAVCWREMANARNAMREMLSALRELSDKLKRDRAAPLAALQTALQARKCASVRAGGTAESCTMHGSERAQHEQPATEGGEQTDQPAPDGPGAVTDEEVGIEHERERIA